MQFSVGLALQYQELFDSCQIRPNKLAIVETITNKIVANRVRYSLVQDSTRVPWWFIGIVHSLEGGINFRTHLHNGDPLTARTRQVPKGRPKLGDPPFTWEESALDALTMAPHSLHLIKEWSLPVTLYELEKYNGFGYRTRKTGINSPYLWSFTNHYVRGKFVKDGVFSSTAVSQQVGAAAVMKLLSKSFALFVEVPTAPLQPVLKIGSAGQAVRELQARLRAKGYTLAVDNKFGRITESVLKSFQKNNGLEETGIADESVWKALS